MSVVALHPFTRLRQEIRNAGRQFRKSNDNSQSLFHPAEGFQYGYDLNEVEAALDRYERTLSEEYLGSSEPLSPQERLLREAHRMIEQHDSVEARAFAHKVAEYLRAKVVDNPLQLLKTQYLVKDLDVLE